MDKSYDIIIAGGGLAGLSLAYHLVKSPLRDRSILIVDKDEKETNDRTWCFWTAEPTLFEEIVSREWRQLRVVGEGHLQELELAEYQYQMIRGIDFYRFVRKELSRHSNVEFMNGKVERIEDTPRAARVIVDGQAITGKWAFSSLFNIRQFRPDTARYRHIEQRFLGWEIETQENAFDPQSATFFDFRTRQEDAVRFFYLLPLSERRALVEVVVQRRGDSSHKDQLNREMGRYIEGVLGIRDYRIVEKEGGVTPLTDAPFPRQLGERVMSIGIPGGRVKPTSGYAFTRIQRDSAAIVQSLVHKGHPFNLPRSSWIFHFCDTMLLQIMREHREVIILTFLKMFRRNPVVRIFRFLDEESSPWENFLLMATLAQPVMLRAFVETYILPRMPVMTLGRRIGAARNPVYTRSGD